MLKSRLIVKRVYCRQWSRLSVITVLAAVNRKAKCFCALVTGLMHWWSLNSHVSETKMYILMKLLHTLTCLTALFPGLPRWASTRKLKPIWILPASKKTVGFWHSYLSWARCKLAYGSGISWAICKFAPRSRQITVPEPHRFFTGRMPFLSPNQQCQSTEGTDETVTYYIK